MALTEMTFDPENGLRDTATYPTEPQGETEARQILQESSDQLRDYINDTLLTELQSVESGSSGADNIGSAPIDGVEVSGDLATTVRGQILGVKTIAETAAAGNLTPGSISNSNMFGSKVVGQSAIADNAIGALQLADNAVDTAAIQDNAVTQAKIADDAVGADQLADSSVNTAAIVNSAVTEAKIGTGAVTETKIGTGAVTEDKLGTIQTWTVETGETVTYDPDSKAFTLSASGCNPVKLCAVVFDTDETPPTGDYPEGTIYIQHEA